MKLSIETTLLGPFGLYVIKFAIALLFLGIGFARIGVAGCEDLFAQPSRSESKLKPEARYLDYFKSLVERNVWPLDKIDATLEHMIEASRRGVVVNPAQLIRSETFHHGIAKVFETLIKQDGFDLQAVEQALRDYRLYLNNKGHSKNRIYRKIILPIRPIEFVQVPDIEVPLLNGKPGEIIRLGYPLVVTSTLITQGQWALEMGGHNPATLTPHFENFAGQPVEVKIDDKNVLIHLNHPVHGVSDVEIMYFANILSIRDRYHPAYEVPLFDVNAHTRYNPDLKAVELLIPRLEFPLNQEEMAGDGYRLPTSKEILYLLSLFAWANLGASEISKLTKDQLDPIQLEVEKFAWLGTNSSGKIQQVATREPFRLPNGDLIYDLYGNRDERYYDDFNEAGFITTGSFSTHSIRGAGSVFRVSTVLQRQLIAFRLVRTVSE